MLLHVYEEYLDINYNTLISEGMQILNYHENETVQTRNKSLLEVQENGNRRSSPVEANQ